MAKELTVLLYNKVELDDGTQGIVRYMGGIMGKKGVFYGIDVTKGDAKNDGTFKGIKYFDTKKGTKTGRFCKANKITKCKKTTNSKFPFKMGETVMCTKTKCKGVIKYVGVPSWVKGGKVYYGLELSKKKGTSNGTNQGVQYFEAKMQYGIYVPAKEVKKVGKKKKKEEQDPTDAMKDYYGSKTDSPKKAPKSPKKSKKKKSAKKKTGGKKKSGKKKIKPKPINKGPSVDYMDEEKDDVVVERLPSVDYMDEEKESRLSAPTVERLHDPRDSVMTVGSVDYMDEEKDGVDMTAYQDRNEEIETEISEKKRRDRIAVMKQMEREDKQRREQEKMAKEQQEKQEKEEREKRKQALVDQRAAEKAKETEKKQKELKDKERLQKYAQAMKEKENAEKEAADKKAKLEEQKKQNELMKQKELEAKRLQQEKEKKELEEQKKLAEKLRQKKEEEEKQANGGGISYASSGGSLKDRMAMFGGGNNAPKKTTSMPTKQASSPSKPTYNNGVKPSYSQQNNNTIAAKAAGGVSAQVNDKGINDEMNAAFGKPFKSVKMTKVAKYPGQIPLVLYLLGEKLIKLNKFGTFKIFLPEEMEKQANKPEMQLAHNIFVFFAKLPQPLLDTIPQNVFDKALNKDVMKDVIGMMDEPYASTLCYLWDILAKVAMNPNARMGQQGLGKVFGPMCTLVTQQDMKGNRVSMNVLGASRMIAFFRRGIEWRMELQGFNFDDSDDDD